MAVDRGKPQNYREHLQLCPLVLYISISEPAMSEQQLIGTICTWFMAAWLKHRILRSGEHLLVMCLTFLRYLMEGGENLMPMAQLLCLTGAGMLLNPKGLKIFCCPLYVIVLKATCGINSKGILVRSSLHQCQDMG